MVTGDNDLFEYYNADEETVKTSSLRDSNCTYSSTEYCNIDPDEKNVILSLLKDLNITAPTFQYEESKTMDEKLLNIHILDGCLTKNLFLTDKIYGLFLVTMKASRVVNLKTIGILLGLTNANLRYCDEELLVEKLNISRGSVSPFALINDTMKNVNFCIDKELLDESIINIHPLRCDRITSISPIDLLAFLQHIEHAPKILRFPVESWMIPRNKIDSSACIQSRDEVNTLTQDDNITYSIDTVETILPLHQPTQITDDRTLTNENILMCIKENSDKMKEKVDLLEKNMNKFTEQIDLLEKMMIPIKTQFTEMTRKYNF